MEEWNSGQTGQIVRTDDLHIEEQCPEGELQGNVHGCTNAGSAGRTGAVSRE